MSDQHPIYDPVQPAPRPAATIAALLLVLLVFFAGLALGQSGVLGGRQAAVAPTAPPASVQVSPPVGATAAPSPGSSPSPAVTPEGSPVPTTTDPATPGPLPSGQPEPPTDFSLFWEALDIIRREFVGRDVLDDRELTYGAIRGLVDALGDTGHSVFLTPEAVAAEADSLGGSIKGIGVLLGERDGRPLIVSVLSDSPAQRAGLRSGDLLVSVDGHDVGGLTTAEIVPLVRGDEGTTVVLVVERPAAGERLEFSIVREEIRIPAADWTTIPGTEIALLRLVQFSQGASDELRAARDAALAAGAAAFILDLRNNPGGFVHEAVNSASLFLGEGTVYIRETATGDRIPVLTNADMEATDLPLVVLIDEGSASSAEILAGALRSAQRGELVGQTTFGTGTVLLPFTLSDGSALRLAVERWLTPDGELIFERGIPPTIEIALAGDEQPLEPDQVAELAPQDVPTMPDAQMRRAVDLLSE